MSYPECYIGAVSTALPAFRMSQQQGEEFLVKHYGGKLTQKHRDIMHKVFKHPGIKERYFAFNSPEDLINEDPDVRSDRFTKRAVELASQAASNALDEASVSPGEVTALVVNTCTGYLCPGLSTYILEKLGLNKSVCAYDLVGSGCGGAIPNLQLCRGLLGESSDGIVLSISVEICSCTFQMDNDPSLIISNALFSDAAAAAVIWQRPQGLELIDSRSHCDPAFREDIRYVYKHGQLYNQLSLKLPKIASEKAAQVVHELLKKHDIKIKDIAFWALHSGGAAVIEKLKQKIGIEDGQVAYSRNVLEKYGNMSSPTVWFVLKEIQKAGVRSGDRILMLAFGAGLSAHAFLLKMN